MNPSQDKTSPPLLGANLLTDLGLALGHHIGLILAMALGTLLCTYVSLQFVSNEYVSTARLLVKLGRENVELPATVEKGGLLSTGVRKEDINSEIQLINSRPLIESTVDAIGLAAFKPEPAPPRTWLQRAKAKVREVVRVVRAQIKDLLIQLNLRPDLSEREEAVLLVQKTLTVEREKDSDVITVSARLSSDLLAMQVVDTLVGLYMNRRVELRRDQGISAFFDEQLGSLRAQLAVLDASKLRMRGDRNISAVNEERSLQLVRLQTLNAEISADERELHLLSPLSTSPVERGANSVNVALRPAPTAGLDGGLAAGSRVGLSSLPNLEQLRSKVTELRLRRTELLQKYTNGAEQVQQVDREMLQIEATLRQAFATQLAERRATARNIEQRMQVLNVGEVGLEVIERDRSVVSQNYQSYAKRREETRVSEALDLKRVSNIAVLASADKPIEPVAPRKLLILGLALPFGLFAGFGVALLLEYLNQTIRDVRDLGAADRQLYLGPLRTPRSRP